MKIEFLWFDECPNHEAARELLRSVLQARHVEADVEDINASDAEKAEQMRFPGSPTIRINGRDVEPGFEDFGEYTPAAESISPAPAWLGSLNEIG